MPITTKRMPRSVSSVITNDGPRHWPGFDRPIIDHPFTPEHRELLSLLRGAHRATESPDMCLLFFDDATTINVTIVPTDGPHPVWLDETVAWMLPVLGPTASVLLPRLYTIGASQEANHSVDDLSFTCGIGRGQLARALDRLSRFHVVERVDMHNLELQVDLRSHLKAPTDRARASWPAWYAAAYDLTFPASPVVPA